MNKIYLVIETIKKLYTKLRLLSIKLYNKLYFLFNKQLTLQKIYEPLTKDRIKTSNSLAVKLARLKLENNTSVTNKENLAKENKLLLEKISAAQEMLVKR